MPRVLVDLRMVREQPHGIARYALELATRLPAAEPGWEFAALVPPEGLPAGLESGLERLRLFPARAGFLSPLEQPSLLADLWKTRCDLFHATSFSLPLLWTGRLVATLHDANHLALAEEYGLAQRAYYSAVVRPRAARAQALLTVSEFSRRELSHWLDLPEERFQVIRLGTPDAYVPATGAEVARARAELSLPARFFAVIGNTKRFKNLETLAAVSKACPVAFAVVAGKGAARSLGFANHALDLGFVPEALMPAFLSASTAVLVPSRYEGFGLPALEAMACGAPVIAARAGALPEVVGSAGLLVEPGNVAAWRTACERIAADEGERVAMRERGLERAARFTWDACVRETLGAYRRALGR
jgi:glycosyltransferase involved in cell wall biosynthesis